MQAKGTVFKYGDNVDTDVIIPARYLAIADKKELAEHCMEDIEISWLQIRTSDVVLPVNMRRWLSKNREFPALSQRHLQESSIVMRSISDFRSLNAWKLQKKSKQVIS